MSPAQILDVAHAAGVRIEPDGDTLRLRAPEKPPDEILELLRKHKPAILEHLRQGIGVARPPEPNRRCSSCTGGLQPSDSDGAICSSCRAYFERIAPTRIQ
jgi:hypothetical protein